MSSPTLRAARRARAFVFLAAAFVAFANFAPVAFTPLHAQEAMPSDGPAPHIAPVRTDSPQETLGTFLLLQQEMEAALFVYMTQPSFDAARRLALLSDQMIALIDLEGVSSASRREVGIQTVAALMDIFGRLPPPSVEVAPTESAMEAEAGASYRIPGTPIRIVRIADGPRDGEYLFSGGTVQAAPRFFRAIGDLPLRTRLAIDSYSMLSPQLTGPLVPPGVVRAMPQSLTRLWLGTPLWKIGTITILYVLSVFVLARLHRVMAAREPSARLAMHAWRALIPAALLLLVGQAIPYVSHQVNVSGDFANILESIQSVLVHVAYAWLFWLVCRMLAEWLILSPRIPEDSLDANLLRLASGVVGVLGVSVILAFGGQAIGLPVLSVLAGLGVGGLAVALALRPTLENLVGGVMLYIDRPVRIGDFCSFGEQTGTVEGIGIRSTTLRALDRTIISVPNAQFADMQIINWAECDQMLIREIIGVRYETTPDQLRFLLAQMREMLHAHPRIDSNTIRVRFVGYGDSALNIELRIYAATKEWNDFFAIREDVFLRIYDIVNEAGAGFAFPSQTLYMARDGGVDEDRAKAAEATVRRWRASGRLPFPRLAPDRIERLEGTLDYPPRGSTESDYEGRDETEILEPLSAPPDIPEPAPGDDAEPEERDRTR